ncbi:MAG TPA: helix-turn-helix domain-containing protein [Oscillatoriaceae cyanobacterium M33_DOE_052]|uniref:Helix-turn-helix domain-containing protein n=1 Tax=Planktothricoides sp. SpSt-374 TaxID=2282167 RepID=A0A7C3VVA6_9CYAN|nr:helix-turn-helix domain-containing protein [Oscillatoriaceae cyanobacterium M33_DOE_052]
MSGTNLLERTTLKASQSEAEMASGADIPEENQLLIRREDGLDLGVAGLSWEARLGKVGQELAQARQAKGMSLDQLHMQTRIPKYHLQSLEAGRVEKLPEPIYVRSFVRQIGNALGLDGEMLAASLPYLAGIGDAGAATASGVKSRSRFILGAANLYLGYAALLLLAIGGLFWLYDQQTLTNGHRGDALESGDTVAPRGEEGAFD